MSLRTEISSNRSLISYNLEGQYGVFVFVLGARSSGEGRFGTLGLLAMIKCLKYECDAARNAL